MVKKCHDLSEGRKGPLGVFTSTHQLEEEGAFTSRSPGRLKKTGEKI